MRGTFTARLLGGSVKVLMVAAALGVAATQQLTAQSAARTSLEKYRSINASSPFNLQTSVAILLEANAVACGLSNDGSNVCGNVFDSPTGGGGFWPSGTFNQYIFNSGLQIAGINGANAGPWSGDTVGAFFFDPKGTTEHSAPLTQIYNSLDPADIAAWPERGLISDTAIFDAALIGATAISDQDTYVEYWDGDVTKVAGRDHPMGILVQQRSMAFNSPVGAEHTIFFVYRFTNVTNDPAFQTAAEARFNVTLPDAGWTITNIYAAFGMDPDVTTHFRENFATAILPFNLGIAYKGNFLTDDFDFGRRADLYLAPFFRGVGFVGVKYLRSPVNPATGEQIGLTMFSNTTNSSVFPDPANVKQLFRYLKGDLTPAKGDQPCTIQNSIANRLCALVQQEDDARFYQASGPFSLAAGQSATIVVGYTHGAPFRAPGYTPAAATIVRPEIPQRVPGAPGQPLRLVEQIAGLIQIPAAAIVVTGSDTSINQRALVPGRDFVPRSLVANALIAQTIFDNKFLAPRPPEPPRFALVPGDAQVTVVWEPSRTEQVGDPYAAIATNPESPIYNPNYRRFDVEGYRIYRATGLQGEFELIAEFDKTGTFFTDVTCELDPEFVPEEGDPCVEHDVSLVGDITMFPTGSRVRDAVGGGVVINASNSQQPETITLHDTGVPFAFVDRGLRNGITYRYIVTAFDVNSLASGSASLESPRAPQFVTPRKDPNNLVFAQFSSSVTNAAGQALPTIANPTINSATGIFSGPQPPTNGLSASFSPVVERLMPAFNLKATIDSIKPYGEINHPSGAGCPKGSNAVGACWRVFMTFDRDGTKSSSIADGYTPFWNFGFGEPLEVTFAMGSGAVTPDAATAAQFGLPSNFPGFLANVEGQFGQNIMYSQAEGHSNRRGLANNEIYPGFATGERMVPGGSRWFSGANETLPDPTALVRVGTLAGADSVWAPIHHTPRAPGLGTAPASTHMQCFPYAISGLGRAADVRLTWGAGGTVTVTDVSHNVPVIFKPTAQVSYGFLNTDANGNGVIDWNDFDYISNVAPIQNDIGFCGSPANPAEFITLQNAPAINPVSFSFNCARNDGFCGGSTAHPAQGMGFGLYINGERYIISLTGGAFPAAGQTWTVRTYTGLVRAPTGAQTLDPSGYSFRGDLLPRQPMVTGLQFNASSSSASGPVGDVDISGVHTVPDPYYVRSAFELGPSNKALRFVGLPPQAIIRIYSLNGTLVRVLEHNDPLGGAEAAWDLRNRNNQFVASGVYFFVVEAAGGRKHTGKFTVVQFAR